MRTLAVAAISARAMAEAAAREGLRTVALDLFGDADTRRVATHWLPIGAPGSLQIDGARVLAALRALASDGPPVAGWIAGSGFEGLPDLLESGAAILPLIGTAPAAVRRVRDPAQFFPFLAAHGLPFPPVRLAPPPDPAGWLMKDAHGCGGWHVRRGPWPGDALAPTHYFQREMLGQPMSATFLANGQDVQVLGCNAQRVRRLGARPFVFCGLVGPVPVTEDLLRGVTAIARAATAQFGLRGLCSLDFVRDGDAIGVLEINPRPPASLSLYPQRIGAPGLLHAHVQACLHGELPSPPLQAHGVCGMEIVFARSPVVLDAGAAQRLAEWPGIRDLPTAGQSFATGDPLCTLTADGSDPAQVRAHLNEGRALLLQSLETTPCH